MSERRIDGFFYGLFMDSDVLAQSKIVPLLPRRAFVDGYALRIGRRATLQPKDAARTYGMVYSLCHAEFERLYSTPGLERYRPETLLAQSLEGESLAVLCYNLVEFPEPDEANAEYAVRLRAALRKLGFPESYISSVA